MNQVDPTMAQQVGLAVSAFQEQRTGYPPKAVTVVLSDDTLVVTLHEALSPAEKAIARTPEGARQLQEYHRQLFETRSTCCGRRSNALPGSRWVKPPRKWRRRSAPWYMPSRTARWCKCSSSPARSPWTHGMGMDQSGYSHSTEESVMLVLSRKSRESVVIGGYGGIRPTVEGHGARYSRHQCETGFRSRC